MSLFFKKTAILALLSCLSGTSTLALPTLGTVTEVSSFTVPRSPSGMFFDEVQSGLLYILCGTNTNGDHYLYAYTTDGEEQCFITIPQAVGMSRVDGFYMTHDTGKAYIVDSQGPIYADQGSLGGSLYEVEWTNPCGCTTDGTCALSSATWTPTVTKSWSLSAADVSAEEGGGNDEYFRNSGVVVVDNSWYAVNGVHPVGGSLTSSYTKSIVQVDQDTSLIMNTWPFDGSTIGHDVDMEGLTCGPDQCSSTLYVGDEYNYIYGLDLESGEVLVEWDLNSIVGSIPADKGIESLTYASTTGLFYAGIQETAVVHVVQLQGGPSDDVSNQEEAATTDAPATETASTETVAEEETTSTGSVASALPTLAAVTEISSFSIPRSPSGMFFDEVESGLLYILCGTNTNGDHYLYAYTTEGQQHCFITIPQAVGMTRVDGFYIVDSKAYIVDSQGPIYASQGDNYLGGSVYEVDWTNPCGCTSDGSCSTSTVTWTPTVTNSWSLSASDVSSEEGGGNDEYFRNSGIVVVDGSFFAVNGVHPVGGSLTSSYTKSIVQVDQASSSVINTWPFDGSTIGHDVDMEGLTCGPDQCTTSLYVGDEYNYIYKLDFDSGTVTMEWDLGSLVGDVPADKGIESLTYASATGYFYAGIQETAMIHVVRLDSVAAPSTATTEATTTEESTVTVTVSLGTPTTLSQCTPTENYPQCFAPSQDPSTQRIRREIRSLSMEEWDKVVSAMWIMKTEESMESGKTKYGDNFRTYDYFVVKHAVATTDSRGDQAHFGAHFISWHSAFVLEFENALLAIDPTIEAMPYWDETIGAPSVFTEDYFGVDPSSIASTSEGGTTSYEVTTGKFANWPISQDFSIADWYPYMGSNTSTVTYNGSDASSSILRGENVVTATYSTRYGSGSSWEARPPSADDWWSCTTLDVTDWVEWYTCIEQGRPSLHSGPHGSIGGAIRDQEGIRGDFEDPITSPNGPIFMFHHANLDRNRLWWMMRNSQNEDLVCDYYGFPFEGGTYVGPRPGSGGNGAFDGAHLNDVVSSTWGFTAEDLGFVGMSGNNSIDESVAVLRANSANDTNPDGFLTHADLVCWMGPQTTLYTYDTNIACLNDNMACNSVQGVVELPPMETIEEETAVGRAGSVTELESSSAVAKALGFVFVLGVLGVNVLI